MRTKCIMFKESLKDYLLYKNPNWILRVVFKASNRCDFFYSKLKSGEKNNISLMELFMLVISVTASIIWMPFVFLYLFNSIFLLHRVFLHRVEVALTTCCSLKCKACSNLMQYYDKPRHVDVYIVKKSIEGLIDSIDSLEKLVLLGGEPFLYPNLIDILEYAKNCRKIKTIQIITNGIVQINSDVLKTLKDNKIYVSVSDYGIKEDKIDHTCRLLEDNGIHFVRIKQMRWYDFGALNDRNRDSQIVQRQYEKCTFKCKCIFNGKMYLCPRSSHGTDLGYYSDNTYVDLLKNSEKAEKQREILSIYYREQYILACKYCDAGTNACKEICCGEQRQKQ